MLISVPYNNICISIDDGGDSVGNLRGWAAICMDRLSYAKFIEEHKNLLSKHKMTVFHGNKFKKSKYVAYEEFGNLIYETASKSKFCYIVFTLMPAKFYKNFIGFAERLSTKTLEKLTEQISDELEYLFKKVAPILFWFAGEFGSYIHASKKFDLNLNDVYLEIADAGLTQKLSSKNYLGYKVIQSGEYWLATLYRSYIKAQIKRDRRNPMRFAPNINDVNLKIRRLEESPLIQSADFIANFGLNHLRYKLKIPKKNYKLKGSLFQKVFNVERIDYNQYFSIKDNEISLKSEDLIPKFNIAQV